MRGQGGDDLLYVDEGADVLDGGAGRDTVVFGRATVADWQAGVLDPFIAADSWLAWEVIQGSAGADRIRTNSWGYDVELRGGGGADVLAAGNGNDVLAGEDGDDVLTGGLGNDSIFGGTGSDTLRDGAAALHGDNFFDFAIGDVIDVSGLRFGGLRYDAGTGVLGLDSAGDGSFATMLYLNGGLQGEFVAEASDDAAPAATAVRLMADSDGDGVGDFRDNAIDVPNPDQRDSDGDGYGNVVDADLNQDLIVDLFDLSLLDERFGSADADADFNGDGSVDLYDLSIMDALFGLAPGPAAPAAPPAPAVVASAAALAETIAGAELASHTMFHAEHGFHFLLA